ncbi:ATP-binding protein [Microbacterium sp. A93]|uniref:ATP-binding protein n=1 Tax=Microbacterium sp. A93 TaxID=3450716 RepID=UPI003F43260A
MSTLAFRLPAEPQTVDVVLDQLERLWRCADHVPFPDRMAFDLAVIETVSNTIQHGVAGPGPLEVGVELDARTSTLQATIVEYGAATPPLLAERTRACDEAIMDAAQQCLTESGRGLALIRTLVTLGFERVGPTNVWRLWRQTGV